jgi:hypothetical protein
MAVADVAIRIGCVTDGAKEETFSPQVGAEVVLDSLNACGDAAEFKRRGSRT